MRKDILIIFFFLTNVNSLLAQKNYEYMGVLQLDDSLFISYRLNFDIVDGAINGFSVTNFGGEHETKSYIRGAYDKKSKEIYFSEYGIEYTKSAIDTYDFCYVNFKGKVRNINNQDVLKGDFKGLYEDGTSCIDGKISLKSIKKLYRQAAKLNKKITRIKKIPDSIKQKADMVKVLDKNKLNVLKKGEVTSVFWDSEVVYLEIWDAGKLDGDRISIAFNTQKMLSKFEIAKKKKIVKLGLNKGKNILNVQATNSGKIPPNTAKIVLTDGNRIIDLLTNLGKGETTTIHLLRK